jgi:hypothetical protein
MARMQVLGLSKNELEQIASMIKRTRKEIEKKRHSLSKDLMPSDVHGLCQCALDRQPAALLERLVENFMLVAR